MNMKHKYRYLLIFLVLAFMLAAVAIAATVSKQPYGQAAPRYYSMTYGDTGSLGTYYLEFPTLTANDQFVTEDATQTLTNKTLTSPVVGGSAVFEGSVVDAYELTLTPDNPTADRTIIMPDYAGAIPIVIAQGYTQTSHSEASAADVTGSSLTLADGWFTEGKTLKYTLGGTVTGANGTISVILYVESAAAMTLTSANGAAGDWVAEFTIVATGAATQRITGILRAEAGAEVIVDYAAGSVNTATAGTIPVKAQVALAHADDTITAEYVRVDCWNKTD
jgi:hypothetical protein